MIQFGRKQKNVIVFIFIVVTLLVLLLHTAVRQMGRNVSLPADLPEELEELYMRNPETLQFVMAWPSEADTQYVLTVEPRTVPLLLQWDIRWGYAPYYGDGLKHCIGLSGCGPTALSMAAIALTGDLSLDPRYLARYAAENGYCTESDGTQWALFSQGLEPLGLCSKELSLSEEAMVNALTEGKLIICSVGPGDFTTKGHFILLCGYEDGSFEIRDPNSIENSAKTWDYETLKSQILAMWEISSRE